MTLIKTTLLLGLAMAQPALAQDRSDFEVGGDVMQFVLPMMAGVCAIQQDRGADFFAGLAVQSVLVQGLKKGLGDAQINHRPNGNLNGFPSGHTAAAFYGATSLARKCYDDRPALGVLAYGAAVAVGLSRMDADKHDLLQVGVGALIGYYANGVTISAGPGSFEMGYTFSF